MNQFMLNIQEAAQFAKTEPNIIQKAYELGQLEGQTVDGKIYIAFGSLNKWIKQIQKQHTNQLSKKQPAPTNPSSNRSLQKGFHVDGTDIDMHEIFDPALYDHQIPDYYKYDEHSEESYKDHYDTYDDNDANRYE